MKNIYKHGNYAIYQGNLLELKYKELPENEKCTNSVCTFFKNTCYSIVLFTDKETINVKSVQEIDSAFCIGTAVSILGVDYSLFGEINDEGLLLDVPVIQFESIKSLSIKWHRYDRDSYVILLPYEKIDSIWYERVPVLDLPFNSPKITYIKMFGQWLDEPLDG